MSRPRMLFILLGLWLFAIVAPSVVSLIHPDNPVVVNLNEEEQNEQGKKGFDEKKLVHSDCCDFSWTSIVGNTTNFKFYLVKSLDTTQEVILPPPERIS